MKIYPEIAIPLVGIVALFCVFVWGYFKVNEPLPPSLTDEQIAAEVRHCNSHGLVYQLYINRRSGFCKPPTTIEVRQ